MVENIPRLTSGNRVLILGIAMAFPLAGNAQTFGYEESEVRVEQEEAESVQERSEEIGTQERTASAVMAADAPKEEHTPVVRLPPDVSSTPATTFVDNDSELDALLTQVARDILGRVKLVDGQSRTVMVQASLDMTSGVITLDVDRAFLPADYGPSFEDQKSLVDNALLHVAEKVAPVRRIDYRFDGRDLYYYFPEVKAADDAAREEGIRRRKARSGSGVAVVSAGHGYFYSYRNNAWGTSRDEHNGVSEGLLTPLYAAELKNLIETRSRMPVVRPRVQTEDATHSDSGKPWWTIAGRYSIAEKYPNNREIWNTYAGSTLWDREEREDINSRPKLANHLSADFVVHLHSNADDNLKGRGSRVIVQPGRPLDMALARSVLCSMKELIQSQSGYESFVIAPDPHEGNKGENREAAMQSIIVETAFHTDPDDAKALLDPVFRSASMKGVEKGIRLFREGKTCEPFVLSPLPDVSLPTGSSKEQPMVFAGNPQFPVTMEFTTANCSKPGACKPSKTTFADPNAPIKANMRCHGTLTGTARWSVVLRDVDGVVTAPVEFQQTCHKPGAA